MDHPVLPSISVTDRDGGRTTTEQLRGGKRALFFRAKYPLATSDFHCISSLMYQIARSDSSSEMFVCVCILESGLLTEQLFQKVSVTYSYIFKPCFFIRRGDEPTVFRTGEFNYISLYSDGRIESQRSLSYTSFPDNIFTIRCLKLKNQGLPQAELVNDEDKSSWDILNGLLDKIVALQGQVTANSNAREKEQHQLTDLTASNNVLEKDLSKLSNKLVSNEKQLEKNIKEHSKLKVELALSDKQVTALTERNEVLEKEATILRDVCTSSEKQLVTVRRDLASTRKCENELATVRRELASTRKCENELATVRRELASTRNCKNELATVTRDLASSRERENELRKNLDKFKLMLNDVLERVSSETDAGERRRWWRRSSGSSMSTRFLSAVRSISQLVEMFDS